MSEEELETEATTAEEAVEAQPEEAEAVVEETAAADAVETPAEEPAEEVSAEKQQLETLKRELSMLPGKWYVLQSYAGYEKRVKQNIETRVQIQGMSDLIFQVEVPTEDVVEIKNGQRKLVTRVKVPGYVLVRLDLNEDSWGLIKYTPNVINFAGNSYNPVPLKIVEVAKLLAGPVEKAAPVVDSGFTVGEKIRIQEGAFDGVEGVISEIKPEGNKLIVQVSIFDRETPVELGFEQVSKLQ